MLTTGTGEEWKNVPTQGMAAYATSSLFQPHKARQAIRDAHEKKIPPILCYYAGLSSIPITRFLAPFGYDAIWIDWEHTSCDVETMTTVRIFTSLCLGTTILTWINRWSTKPCS